MAAENPKNPVPPSAKQLESLKEERGKEERNKTFKKKRKKKKKKYGKNLESQSQPNSVCITWVQLD